MDSSLVAALQAQTIRLFVAVEIVFTGRTVRVIDGSGVVSFSSKTFTGSDDWFGTLAGVSSVSDEIANQEKGISISFAAPKPSGLDELVTGQGAPVSVWLGVLNTATGAPIGAPELVFSGELQTSEEVSTKDGHNVTLDVASIWRRMLLTDEGWRLNGAWHEQAWPGEFGLQWTHGLASAQTQTGVYIDVQRTDVTNYRGIQIQRNAQ